jgi:hypothetical protein
LTFANDKPKSFSKAVAELSEKYQFVKKFPVNKKGKLEWTGTTN